MLGISFYLRLVAGLFIFGANDTTPPPHTVEELIDKYYSFCKQFPQQKIYIHTDKPYYLSGDDLYGKIYLITKAGRVMIVSGVKRFMSS